MGVDVAQERSPAFWLVLVAGLLLAGGVAIGFLRRAAPLPAVGHTPLTADEKAYLARIVVTDSRMSAAQNFIGDTITYLDARATNHGLRTVRELELRLEFVDTLDQVVLRDTARPVTRRVLPLDPGQTRAFRVSFDHMPADWNQGPPRITPTDVRF